METTGTADCRSTQKGGLIPAGFYNRTYPENKEECAGVVPELTCCAARGEEHN
jgi:hypothetical protein